MQERGQVSQLLRRQPPRRARWWPVAQGLWSPLVGAFHPLADGPFADAQRQGDLALWPAFLLEVPGLETSSFSPVGVCAVHAWECITTSRFPRFSFLCSDQ